MLDKNNIPKHIAIIMDGNGRWAAQRGLPRTAGHRQGTKRVKEIIKAAAELAVEVLTLFAFSTENWSRPKTEVEVLMRYLSDFLDKEIKELQKNNIRFLVIGRDEPLPKYIQEKISRAEDETKANSGLVLVLALNYGARQEIVDAAKKIVQDVSSNSCTPADINEESFSRYLYTSGLPDPDLLIRTSGEMRISNFLLWQLSYAELYFPKKYWPDFKGEDLKKAIAVFQRRQRRFGVVDVNQKSN
jgi:undecaprenyl diphosphate synthase